MSGAVERKNPPCMAGEREDRDRLKSNTSGAQSQIPWKPSRRYLCRQERQHTTIDTKARIDIPSFYTGELGRLSGHGTWKSARCPFHDDHHPSLRVNTSTGAFRCMTCGEGGGDTIAFLMKRFDLSFPEALRELRVRAGL
jgi:hypothetical protein